jgi:putative ABC transport system permease protein
MALTDFTIIRRSMFSRLFSTITTTITVAVAVGLMLVLLSMRDAGRQAFERGSGNMHLLVSADSNALTAVLNSIFYANPPQRPLTWEKYQQLAGEFPYEYAIPTQLGDSYKDLPVLATTPEFFSKFKPDPDQPWRLADGRFFEKEFEVVVGSNAAKTRGLNVGDDLYLTHGMKQASFFDDKKDGAMKPHEHREFIYKVVGILRPTGSAHDRALFTDLTSTWIIHAHDRRKHGDSNVKTTTASHLLDSDRKITGIYLRLPTRAGSDVPAALPQVFDQLRRDTSIVVAQPSAWPRW